MSYSNPGSETTCTMHRTLCTIMASRLLHTQSTLRLCSFTANSISRAASLTALRSAHVRGARGTLQQVVGGCRFVSSSTGGAETDGAAAILAQKKVVEDARRDVENAKAAYERGKEELQRTKKERSYFAYLRGGKQSIFNMGVAFVLLALATRGLAEKTERETLEEQMFVVHGHYKRLLSCLEDEEWAQGAAERLGVKGGKKQLIHELKELVRRNEMTEKEREEEDLLREHANEVRQRPNEGPGAMKRMLM